MRILCIGDDPDSFTGFAHINKRLDKILHEFTNDILWLVWNSSHDTVEYNEFEIEPGKINIGKTNGINNIISLFIDEFKPDVILLHNDLNLLYNIQYTSIGSNQPLYDKLNKLDIPLIWIGPFDSLIVSEIDKKALKLWKYSLPYTIYGEEMLNAYSHFALGPTIPVPVDKIDRDLSVRKFLSIGINREKKQLDKIVTSFLKYHETHRNSMLTIKTYQDFYFREIIKFDSLPMINIITDIIPEDELVKLYEEHDTYISATPNEGWGIPLSTATHYNMTIHAVDFPVHGEATGNNYIKIPTVDLMNYDGYRYYPVVNYNELYKHLDTVKQNNNKIDYWTESENTFRNIIKQVL